VIYRNVVNLNVNFVLVSTYLIPMVIAIFLDVCGSQPVTRCVGQVYQFDLLKSEFRIISPPSVKR